MPICPSPGLALLGSCNLAAHLAAIRAQDLRVVGCWSEDSVATESRVFAEPSQALNHPETQGVVVCTPLHEREHWVRQAVRAAKPVLCVAPPAKNFTQMVQLAAEAKEAGVQILLVSRLRLHADAWPIRPVGVLYFSLRADIPRQLLHDTREGVLLHWGAELLQVMADRFGPLESVYARTRSLGINRPEEDLVSALLRFRNGVEGLAEFNGLGEGTGVELREWSAAGAGESRVSWGTLTAQLLEPHYREFKALLTSGQLPGTNLAARLEGFRWAEWLQQSARLDREIHAKEVVHG